MASASFDPSRQGKYRVQIGDSLLDSGNPRTFASFRYNCAPSEDADISNLKIEDDGNYSLTYNGSAQESTYSGVQRPGRKLECLLVYNPATNSFSLEKVDSTFTFNQTKPPTSEPEIPIFPADLFDNSNNKEKEDSSAGSENEENLADAENPFDVRHFLKHVKESDTEEEESEKEQEMEENDESDSDVEMTPLPAAVVKEPSPPPREPTPPPAIPADRRAPPAPAAGLPTKKAPPRKKKEAVDPFMKPKRRPAGAKSPAPAAAAANKAKPKDTSMSPQSALPSPAHVPAPAPVSLRQMGGKKKEESESDAESDEDESDEDESEEESSYRPPPRSKPPVRDTSRPTSLLGAREEPAELELPSIGGGGNHADADDESDEDAEEDGDGEVDLFAELQAEFEGAVDGGGGGELIIEGDDADQRKPTIGLGIAGIGGGGNQVPISLSGMAGSNSRRDESEESSSEEE